MKKIKAVVKALQAERPDSLPRRSSSRRSCAGTTPTSAASKPSANGGGASSTKATKGSSTGQVNLSKQSTEDDLLRASTLKLSDCALIRLIRSHTFLHIF